MDRTYLGNPIPPPADRREKARPTWCTSIAPIWLSGAGGAARRRGAGARATAAGAAGGGRGVVMVERRAPGKSSVRALLLLALLAGALLVGAGPAAAQAPLACAPRDHVLRTLARDHGETPVARGLTAAGAVLEILAAEGGTTFTVLLSLPDGRSCLVDSGEGWEFVFTLPGAEKIHDWYAPECCSGQDCAPLPEGASVDSVRGGDAVRLTPGSAPVFFPHAKVRPSQDGDYHACVSSTGTPFCLYVPVGA